MMAETTDKKQAHGFKPGQSGNPAGRPKGARNKTTLAVEALLDGDAEALTREAIEKSRAIASRCGCALIELSPAARAAHAVRLAEIGRGRRRPQSDGHLHCRRGVGEEFGAVGASRGRTARE